MNDDFLSRMAASSRARAAAARAKYPEPELRARAGACPAAVPLCLAETGFDLIAEIKRRSPSAGVLAGDTLQPVDQARAYADGGAAALSVLTEPEQFHGSLDDLGAVAGAVPGTPAMRKDFLVDPYQVVEARAAGASGVLLIAAILPDGQLDALLDVALELGMFALVETFDEADVEYCTPVMQTKGLAIEGRVAKLLLGVNCRDLRSLDVDFQRFEQLASVLPDDFPAVAESGVETPQQAATVSYLGYDLALVGTALMRAADPAAAVSGLLQAGRHARG